MPHSPASDKAQVAAKKPSLTDSTPKEKIASQTIRPNSPPNSTLGKSTKSREPVDRSSMADASPTVCLDDRIESLTQHKDIARVGSLSSSSILAKLGGSTKYNSTAEKDKYHRRSPSRSITSRSPDEQDKSSKRKEEGARDLAHEVAKPCKKAKTTQEVPAFTTGLDQANNPQIANIGSDRLIQPLEVHAGAQSPAIDAPLQQIEQVPQLAESSRSRERQQSPPFRLAAGGKPPVVDGLPDQTISVHDDRELQNVSDSHKAPDILKVIFAQVLDEKLATFKKEFERPASSRNNSHGSEASVTHQASSAVAAEAVSQEHRPVAVRPRVRLAPVQIDLTNFYSGKLSSDERERRWPEKTGEIPMERRKSDAVIIAIGKLKNPYEWHYGARYAFSYGGTLRKEYWRLIGSLDRRREILWTPEEISRLLH